MFREYIAFVRPRRVPSRDRSFTEYGSFTEHEECLDSHRMVAWAQRSIQMRARRAPHSTVLSPH
eukprot:2915042-Prymnesium_polylepis.1